MKLFRKFLISWVGGISMLALGNTNNTATNKDAAKVPPKEENNTIDPSSAMAQEKNTLTVGVKGMVCAFCATGIEKSFMAQPEVESIVVSLEKKFLKLTFKPGKSLSNEKIGGILKDAGYEANFGK